MQNIIPLATNGDGVLREQMLVAILRFCGWTIHSSRVGEVGGDNL